jgi:hypothetical protein
MRNKDGCLNLGWFPFKTTKILNFIKPNPAGFTSYEFHFLPGLYVKGKFNKRKSIAHSGATLFL